MSDQISDWQKETREKVERTHAYAEAVANALGSGWTYARTLDGDRKLTWYATLKGPIAIGDGMELRPILHLTRDARTGRYKWSGMYPRDVEGQTHIPYKATCPEITLAPTKPPAQAARDITRRLLVPYLVLLAQCQQSVNQADAFTYKTVSNVGRLANALGVKPENGGNDSLRFYWRGGDTYGYVQVTGDRVHIDIRSISMAQAESLLLRLREANV